jgi:hypothetical protein
MIAVALSGLISMGPTCSAPPPTTSSPAALNPVDPPLLWISVNAVEEDLNDVLIVPPWGFVLNVSWQAVDTAVRPSTLAVSIYSSSGFALDATGMMRHSSPDGAYAVYPEAIALPMGSYVVAARIRDRDESEATAFFEFAVRSHVPPIGTDQKIWFDFDADRDATPGADFDVDLVQFGFTSPSAPALHATMRQRVIDALLDRVAEVYFDSNPNALPLGDPIKVEFLTADPGLPSTTRICVGGSANIYGLVGSILLDPSNQNRASVECSSLPATGIFPRGLNAYANSPGFQQYLNPIRPAAGGIPVGNDPRDATILDPAFDLATASEAELQRLVLIEDAVSVFGDVLGSIIAHETAHALGLVPPAAPGVGLFGGQQGAESTHNVDATGATPTGNFLMNAGNSFSFESLGGLAGHPLPKFRPLNHAYLRDRAVLDPLVTAILPPPTLTSVTPGTVTSSLQTLTLRGTAFVATPSVRVRSGAFTHEAFSEVWVSSVEMRATVSKSSLYPGTYSVELTNPDGQWIALPATLIVP